MQDVNNLKYDDVFEKTQSISEEQRKTLVELLEKQKTISWGKIKKALGLHKNATFNLEASKKGLEGNITACSLSGVIKDWYQWSAEKQQALVEDMTTINKKSVLKKRLTNHWQFDSTTAIRLCLLELPSGHMNLSLKAIKKILPHLEQGCIYSNARQQAGYGYERQEIDGLDRLPQPIDTNNPIVNKALHELRHVVNAVIKQFGKPDVVRVEMARARDLENRASKRKQIAKQDKENADNNKEAAEQYELVAPSLGYSSEASKTDKLKYKRWKQQNKRCAYSNRSIALVQVFSAEVEVDHILPYKQSLDNSYMNKVLAFAKENRYKSNRTPAMAWEGNTEKWHTMLQALNKWKAPLRVIQEKRKRFQMQKQDLLERDFSSTQLHDTRYIARLALDYFAQLGVDVQATNGVTTAWLRNKWGLNTLLGDTDRNEKERVDHRHHAVDALVVAATSRGFYQRIVADIKRSNEPDTKETLPEPMPNFRAHVQNRLQDMVISHVPQYGLSGALHKETGVGFMQLKQDDDQVKTGTVYRKRLDASFNAEHASEIVDKAVREIVIKHLEEHKNEPKDAFAEGVVLQHKDGETPIKRVRVWQAKMTEKELQTTKLGVFDKKQGKVFKYFAYGNTHHVEIIRHRKTGKVEGRFVTMMEASKRIKGMGCPKQPMVKRNHGEEYEFIMALHISDTVSILNEQQERVFYRVQKLRMTDNDLILRLHTATTLNNKAEESRISINQKRFDQLLPILHSVSPTGQLSTKACYLPLGDIDNL